ncbi:MAG TPA: metallophosphoesterase [Pyrinomonadaceae bacterium]|nr:metallophosphoesterase [Pyrinomonadaceae bacterium]
MIGFLRAYKRVIIFSLVFAFSAFLLIHPGELGRFRALLFFAIFVMLIASQFFWIRRVLDLGERFIPGKPGRAWLAVIAGVVYLFFFAYSFRSFGIGHIPRPADPRLHSVLIAGAFSWWMVGSLAGFGLVMVFWTIDRAARAAAWVYRRARKAAAAHAPAPKPAEIALPSPTRRRFLEQTAIALCATPFVAAAYGILYGRLDVEATHQRIQLARLPKAFEGFRIVQLSDFHISPFMPADQIRRCVTITNQLKADLVVLTGDFLGWDPAAQGDVVQALASLRAPYGVFGCLGNHETETQTEESITQLFAAQDVRILRQQRASIRLGGETINLIGVDDSLSDLRTIKPLVLPDTINILLSHWPDFDRAVELGIDLTLAGHTHGGQLSLEFLRRGLSLSRLETPYVRGWYEKAGAQLYVNRGIGTTGFPIRFGSSPEITVFELVRGT